MKLSRFNVWVKDYPQAGEYLLFNTRTQALLKIKAEIKQALEEFVNPQSTVHGPQIKDHLEALRENGIVVEDEQEEQAKLSEFFRQLIYESRALPFEVTILTTYSCNFRCVYCFEQSVRENIYMDGETSNRIIDWLIRRAEQRKLRRLFLVYYGGEPLLNVRPIYDISWHLKQWAEQKGVGFGYGIITNGSLVNPDLIDKLLTVGLEEIRISLDGDREAHNRNRPLANGQPSFDLIINNIKNVIDKVKVGIAGNFDRASFASIPRLLDYLEQEGILRKLNRIDFSPLTPRLGPKDQPGAIELGGCLSFFGKDGLFNEVLAIKKELLRRGVKVHTGLAVNACPLIMQDAGVTIDPQGVIYKCNALVGYPEFSLGNVRDGTFDDKAKEFTGISAWDKCPADCPYVPLCQGGCRFYSYLENKNFSGLSCKREYLDQITPELIKLEYAKLLAL